MKPWMIYGANGYTGELIAREAVRRGLRPILAGRSPSRIESLARELGLESRIFSLNAPDLSGVSLVLHCAGPFAQTSAPMVRACLAAGTHYLDITGEISVFESIMSINDEAVRRGVTLLPGVGFDVVPTDCMAATLASRLPDASELWLAFYASRAEVSRGTLKTMIDRMGDGAAIRRDGKIVPVPMFDDVREIPFDLGKRTAAIIPWGDVSTAFHTTGIPNIRVYSGRSPRAIARMRRWSILLPILRVTPVKRLLQKLAERRSGPDAKARATGHVHLWARVSNPRGQEETMTMTIPEGYAFTVLSAVAAVERVLQSPPRPGSFTPARYLGADFIYAIPGVIRTS